MALPYFPATISGLTATIDAISLIVSGVSSYFQDPNRALPAPPPVYSGEWKTFQVATQGPPGYVIIGPGAFTIYGAANWPKGLALTPGAYVQVSLSPPLVAPVVGVRVQTFLVWVHGLSTATDPTQVALAQQAAAFALLDLTSAALRDIHGHDLPTAPGKPLNPERGEFNYGAVLASSFDVPIPIFGDVMTYEAAQALSGTVLVPPATTGDAVTVT